MYVPVIYVFVKELDSPWEPHTSGLMPDLSYG